MELIREILDRQVLDREQTKIGRVDGLVLEMRGTAPPRLAFIEIGSVALSRRLAPWLGRWVSHLAGRFFGRPEPHRIAWGRVSNIELDIELDIDVRETAIFAWQDWLRRHVIGRIP